jgi:23S rRNA pseudouridine2605 synthase
MPAERLQKIIAAAGVASRRKAEDLITEGRVIVNGQVVTELGTKADIETDHIRVDGKLLQGPERYTYIALNKPKGYVTTVSDEKKRPTVMDLVQKVKGRVYPVGRLDWASEGLILMTNDGALANGLMKASSNVPKVYVVKVAGQPDETKLDKLRRGVSIAEKGGRRVRTAPAKIRLIREGDNPWLEVTIIEGRNRQVRKMFEEVGHHVEKIRRVQYGPLALDVPPGDWRNLTLLEVAKLKTAAAGGRVPSPPTPAISLHPPRPKPKPIRPSRAATSTQSLRPPKFGRTFDRKSVDRKSVDRKSVDRKSVDRKSFGSTSPRTSSSAKPYQAKSQARPMRPSRPGSSKPSRAPRQNRG